MAFPQSAARRPIEGAVATLGVSDRVAFLRKTYAHLGIALAAFAVLTAAMFRLAPLTSWKLSEWAMSGRWNWLMVVVLFMVVSKIAERLALSETSRGVQYLGLGMSVVAWSALLQPVLWVLVFKFGNPESLSVDNAGTLSGPAAAILMQSVVITLTIFVGLTATVFVTKKDFSFLRGALTIGAFAALGVIVASLAFGFSLGALFCGAMIVLMAGYILFQTSLVMSFFPPSSYVAAALMLFSTVAMLFWYVLQLMMDLNRR